MPEQTTTVKTRSLPPIDVILSDAWETFIKIFWKLITTQIIFYIISVGLFIFAGIALGVLGLGSLINMYSNTYSQAITPNSDFSPDIFSDLASISPGQIISIIAIFLIVMIASGVLKIVNNITIIKIIGSRQLTINEAIKEGFKLIIPAIILSLISGFFLIGSYFAFFLPVIVVSYLFSFIQYKLAIKNNTGMTALKNSVQIVWQNFWGIAFRFFIIGIILVILMLAPPIVFSAVKLNPLISTIMRSVINLTIMTYGMTCAVSIYKAARANTNLDKNVNISGLWITTIVGYVLGFLIIFLLLTFGIKSVRNNARDTQQRALEMRERRDLELERFDNLSKEIDYQIQEKDLEKTYY